MEASGDREPACSVSCLNIYIEFQSLFFFIFLFWVWLLLFCCVVLFLYEISTFNIIFYFFDSNQDMSRSSFLETEQTALWSMTKGMKCTVWRWHRGIQYWEGEGEPCGACGGCWWWGKDVTKTSQGNRGCWEQKDNCLYHCEVHTQCLVHNGFSVEEQEA